MEVLERGGSQVEETPNDQKQKPWGWDMLRELDNNQENSGVH